MEGVTDPALPPPPVIAIGVRLVVAVAPQAMRLASEGSRNPVSPQDIFARCDGLNVRGIDAGMISAEVIGLKAVRERPD